MATASILAGVAVTLVGFDLTVFATEARLADAGVAALAGVGTRGVIPAGLVIGAEVQILIAEQAAPAFFASALKRLVAGAMQAPRVPRALIAEGAFPSNPALALTGGLTITVLLTTARQADGFGAIIAFPSRKANSVASGVTVEVAEGIIPWAAEIRAFLAVVEFIAHDTIRKAQLALLTEMHVLRPVLTDSESSFGGQTAYHVVVILC